MDPNHHFSQYLRTLVEQDPKLLSDEMYFMAVNCSQKGLHFDVSVQPLFISKDLTQRYSQFGYWVEHVLSRLLEVLRDPGHSHYFALKALMQMNHEIEEILHCRMKGKPGPGVVRPDTVLSQSGFHAHEFNVSWPGGVADTDIIMGTLSQNTLFNKFREQLNFQGLDIILPEHNLSCKLLLEELIDTAGKQRPFIALVHPRPYGPTGQDLHLAEYLRDAILESGHDCALIFPDQLEMVAHTPRFEGREIDVVYRFFEWHHIQQDPGFLGYRRILRAAMNGDLAVVNSFTSEALSAKSVFEILWDNELSQIFDSNIVGQIRHHIPQTFNLSKADQNDLAMLIEEKDHWVVKPVKGSSGMQVFMGKLVDDHNFWNHVIMQGKSSGEMVAQRYVETPGMNVMEVKDEGGFEERMHYIDVNPFYFRGHRGNFFGRWSRTYMTAQCNPGLGGMYPVCLVQQFSGN